MAAVIEGGLLARLFGARSSKPSKVAQSKEIYKFTARAHKETNGATPELKRVYRAYLESQKKSAAAR
jgi:hypothetical protein